MSRKINQKGFTIIEVLIVLAIAGLIMLIVFLAVPALQRNSRNTQRKNDVAKILGAVNTYMSEHRNQLPSAAEFRVLMNNTNFAIYDTAVNEQKPTVASKLINLMEARAYAKDRLQSDIKYSASPTAPVQNSGLVDVVNVVGKSKCDGTTGNSTTTDANAKQFVALYSLEMSGDPKNMCQES
jgi:prepilin-type N-terminal cleavage/methylation domain-containing protein